MQGVYELKIPEPEEQPLAQETVQAHDFLKQGIYNMHSFIIVWFFSFGPS